MVVSVSPAVGSALTAMSVWSLLRFPEPCHVIVFVRTLFEQMEFSVELTEVVDTLTVIRREDSVQIRACSEAGFVHQHRLATKRFTPFIKTHYSA